MISKLRQAEISDRTHTAHQIAETLTARAQQVIQQSRAAATQARAARQQARDLCQQRPAHETAPTWP